MKNVNLSTEDLDRLSSLLDSLEQAKRDKAEKNVIMNKIMDFFREQGIKSYRYGNIRIQFTDTRETNQFDVDMLRAKYPAIWEECHSVQVREPHLAVTKLKTKIKEEEDDVPTDEELLESMAEDLAAQPTVNDADGE